MTPLPRSSAAVVPAPAGVATTAWELGDLRGFVTGAMSLCEDFPGAEDAAADLAALGLADLGGGVRVTVADGDVARLGAAVATARAVIGHLGGLTGWGLAAPPGTRPTVRGWSDVDVDVCVTPDVALVGRAGGELWITDAATSARLQGWSIVGGALTWVGVDAHGRAVGGTLEGTGADALASLAPGATRVDVVDVALADVWCPTIDGLLAAVEIALDHGATVEITG